MTRFVLLFSLLLGARVQAQGWPDLEPVAVFKPDQFRHCGRILLAAGQW